ncbi:hypothetical protein [Haloarchaeobius litoreus]|uniref:Uncharacterized protein n=1 Tax=Haloarchaeobius litoreus TaxID=755306 RepID=A0ABD6DNU7_9EURY|nr:hypothetical protein [Haloarchaeobius litoreus]
MTGPDSERELQPEETLGEASETVGEKSGWETLSEWADDHLTGDWSDDHTPSRH